MFDRRTFVALSSLAIAPKTRAAEWSFFTPAEAALVDSICDCIVPADQDPGARQAGVVHYIDQQLTGALARFADAYRKGLETFAKASPNFSELGLDQRTAFLTQVEQTNPAGLASFFNMVIDHTMQGFYGSPEHGGNRDQASWKMLGIQEFMHQGGSHA